MDDVKQTHIIKQPMAGRGCHSKQPQIDSHREEREREQGWECRGAEIKAGVKGRWWRRKRRVGVKDEHKHMKSDGQTACRCGVV